MLAATALPLTPQPPAAATVPAFSVATSQAAAAATLDPVAAPKPPATAAAPVSDFSTRIKKFFEDGSLSDGLVAEIKRRFAEPFASVSVPTVVPAPPQASLTAATSHAWGIGVAVAPAGATLLPRAAPVPASALQGTTETHADIVATQQVKNASELLNLLLACDSGFNNSESATSEDDAREEVAGLHAVVGSIAASAASDIAKYLHKELSANASSGDSVTTLLRAPPRAAATGDQDGPGRCHVGSNRILLAAQCLYILSRHFQMQATFVKEILAVVEMLLDHIRVELSGRAVQFDLFRDAPETAPLCTLTWLIVFSVVNAVAVWKLVRSPSGSLGHNALILSDVAETIHHVLTKLRGKYAVTNTPTEEPFSYLPLALSTKAAANADGRTALKRVGGYGTQTQRWLAVVDGFLSILTLAEGCLLNAKGDDRGYDRALDAFLGERDANKTTMCRGKVTKRMVQLAPSPATLVIPMECVFIAPYEVLSFLFDDMLPLLRHLADLEVASYRRFLDQLQLLEEFPHSAEEGVHGPLTMGSMGMLHGPAQTGAMLSGREENGLPGSTTVLEPFTSEMAHILECLVVCLQHLPPEVLNPDLDVDCAATFFMFRNCTRHMSQVFKVQRGTTTLWESFTLKLVTKYLEVLAMIGRNPQYVERVVAMLINAQLECQELRWSGLVGQALECAGLNRGSNIALSAIPGTPMNDVFQQEAGRSATKGPLLHRQFTPAYGRQCQQRYVASFFMLLRQAVVHPVVREKINEYISLELALAFLFAPQLSQPMLGSVLALISALITNAAEAATVWTFLEQNKLLQPPQFSASATATACAPTDYSHSCSTLESRSLLGHCQLECTKGVYSITIGFLNLLIALFRYDAPSMARFSTYTSIVHFVSQKIFQGVSRRAFVMEVERNIVASLAAAALRQALLARIVSDGTTAVIPFVAIMATSKSPSDVAGEALHVILQARNTPHELATPQRAAVRQCLHLLNTAMQAVEDQKLDIFSFDSRITQNAGLAYHVLYLCGTNDPMLTKAVLQLLLRFPRAVMSQAAALWYTNRGRLSGVLQAFVCLLRPQAMGTGGFIRAPPELAILDADPGEMLINASSTAQLTADNRSLILDLLIRHAPNPEPSVTSWMCGFYIPTDDARAMAKLEDTQLLSAVVEGGTHQGMDAEYPSHAVKYVKLLYLLRANQLYGASVVRQFMEHGCQGLFLHLQTFRPEECAPLLLSKHAYVMKLLALEACTTYLCESGQLDVSSSAIPTVPVGVLLSLLHPRHRTNDWAVGSGETAVLIGGASADISQWLVQVLNRMPAFPACTPPTAAAPYLFPATDGIIQYNVSSLYEAFQQEQSQLGQPKLSVASMREKLIPFVDANHCFLVYASVVSFVEGWCQLLSISCSVVAGLSPHRMREFYLSILQGMEATRTMALAAQEQVSYHLFDCLTTITTHLQRKCEEVAATAQAIQAGQDPFMALTHGAVGVGDGVTAGDAVAPHRTAAAACTEKLLGRTLHGRRLSVGVRRRPREPDLQSRLYATDAGDRSNFLSSNQRSRILRTASMAPPADDTSSVSVPDQVSCSANQALLRPLVRSMANWGGRIPMLRGDMYLCLLSLTLIPDVTIDDPVVFRSQDSLFDLLSADISLPTPSTRRHHALMLLVDLLQASPSLCEAFCGISEGREEGLGPLPTKCGQALLDGVDAAVRKFVSAESGDIREVLWLIRGTFDFLSVISRNYGPQVLQSHLVQRCLLMECWTLSTHIIFGYTPTDSAGATLEHNREVLKRLLLGTVRWFNVMMAVIGDAPPFVLQMQEFVRLRRQVIEHALEVSIAGVRTGPMNAVSLTLFAEVTELLRGLSTTFLAEECRVLVNDMAMPELLLSVCGPAFEACCRQYTREALVEASGPTSGPQDSAPERQVDLIAVSVRNLAHLMLRAEYGVRHLAEAVGGREDLQRQMIRSSSRSVEFVFAATSQVAAALESVGCGTEAVTDVRLENYILALHALVCLVHSFVLPLASPTDDGVCSQSFIQQLRTIPLENLLALLQKCQHAIYSLRGFNADYRTGIHGQALSSPPGGGWTVSAKGSISNALADATGMSLSTTARLAAAPAAEPSTRAAGSVHRESTPSTPMMLPVDGNNLMGTASVRTAAGRDARKTVTRALSQELTNVPTTAGSITAVEARDGCAESETVPLHTKAVLSQSADFDLNPNLTIAQLANLPEGGGIAAGAMVADPDEWARTAPITWEDVLGMENAVRHVKISIANAIRAVRAAAEALKRS